MEQFIGTSSDIGYQHARKPRRPNPRRNGPLMAVGGALRLDGPILREFFHRCGGSAGRIVILPTASRLANAGHEYAAVLRRMGMRAVVLPVRTRADALRPDLCAQMRAASGVFMTGGDQTRLVHALLGTPLHRELVALHRRGGMIAGTSAGTAALSALMITGGASGILPRRNTAQVAAGLGLIDHCVFDQHFRQRNRIGRLLDAVSRYPHLLGIGVDEDTAAVIEGDTLRVVGSGAVTLVDASALPPRGQDRTSRDNLQPVEGVRMQILTTGSRCSLRRGGPPLRLDRAERTRDRL